MISAKFDLPAPPVWSWLVPLVVMTLGWIVLFIGHQGDDDMIVFLYAFALVIGLTALPLIVLGIPALIVFGLYRFPASIWNHGVGDTLAWPIIFFIFGPFAILFLFLFGLPTLGLVLYISVYLNTWLNLSSIISIWVGLIILLSFLWYRGLSLERLAKNPLRSILDQQSLQILRPSAHSFFSRFSPFSKGFFRRGTQRECFGGNDSCFDSHSDRS